MAIHALNGDYFKVENMLIHQKAFLQHPKNVEIQIQIKAEYGVDITIQKQKQT